MLYRANLLSTSVQPDGVQSVLLVKHERSWEWISGGVERKAAICLGYSSRSEDQQCPWISLELRERPTHVVVSAGPRSVFSA